MNRLKFSAIIISALLHDTLEDTDLKAEIIKEPDFVRQSRQRVEEYYLPWANKVDPSGYLRKELQENVDKAKRVLG